MNPPTRDRCRIAREVIACLGPLARYQDFRARMVLIGFPPPSHTNFIDHRDEVWPDWRATKKEAKQRGYVNR